jgi:hypothetical protein
LQCFSYPYSVKKNARLPANDYQLLLTLFLRRIATPFATLSDLVIARIENRMIAATGEKRNVRDCPTDIPASGYEEPDPAVSRESIGRVTVAWEIASL